MSTPGAQAHIMQDGTRVWHLGQWLTLKAGADWGTGLGLAEESLERGYAPPMHTHHREEEAFYVLEGRVRFFAGDEETVLGPGGLAYLYRDIPHSFLVESATARLLSITSPAGFENFFRETQELWEEGAPPPADPEFPARLARLAERFGCEIVGPPPVARPV